MFKHIRPPCHILRFLATALAPRLADVAPGDPENPYLPLSDRLMRVTISSQARSSLAG
jgi:hypothetical protein